MTNAQYETRILELHQRVAAAERWAHLREQLGPPPQPQPPALFQRRGRPVPRFAISDGPRAA